MTVEEKANKLLDKIGNNSLGSPINAAYEGFLAGYEEAIRWRDPKEERPGKSLPVVVKYEVSDGHVKYWVEEYSYERFVHDADDIGAKIIGWRPI